MFEWEGVDAATKNLPFAAPVATAELAVEIGGQAITVKRPVEYRYADSIRGEIRRPFTIVPGLTVAFDSKLDIVPLADLGKPRRVAVRLQNQTLRNPEGTVSLKLPAGWKSEPAQVPFTLKDLIGPIGVAAMLPFIPIALIAMPLEVILHGVVKLLV